MIQLNNVSKKYKDGTSAIENISLDIQKGEFISVIGPSGCGKSTLLKLINGLLKPNQGTISVQGKASFVFQKPVLLPWKNVMDNIRLCASKKNQDKKNIQKLLSLVGLSDFKYHYPYQLSGGMQQRIALARSLNHDVSILLMDEPFGALDEMTREKLNNELINLWNKLELTVIFVTHSISEAVFLSDKVMVMSSRPAKVTSIVDINLNFPRERESSEFQEYVKCIKQKLN